MVPAVKRGRVSLGTRPHPPTPCQTPEAALLESGRFFADTVGLTAMLRSLDAFGGFIDAAARNSRLSFTYGSGQRFVTPAPPHQRVSFCSFYEAPPTIDHELLAVAGYIMSVSHQLQSVSGQQLGFDQQQLSTTGPVPSVMGQALLADCSFVLHSCSQV